MNRFTFNTILLLMAACGGAPSVARAQEQPGLPEGARATTSSLAAAQPADNPAGDPAAEVFVQKCSSCHTVGGGAIGNAPDLLPSTQWPRADLETAIKRMEKNVGPLSADEVTLLGDLLQAPDVRVRLDAARAAIQARRQAQLAPASPRVGEQLFLGRQAFTNGGMACAACHTAGGVGGSLAVDLTQVFSRMGETGLQTAAQNANFPIMKAAYAQKLVTEQEAAHLVAYFRKVDAAASAQPERQAALQASAFVGWGGFVLAGVGLGAMTHLLRRRDRGGVRAELIRKAQGSGR